MDNRNNGLFFIGFLFAAFIVMAVIGSCYLMVLATTAPETHPALRWLLALGLVAVFYMLLVMSARSGGGSKSLANRSKIVASFVALYLCSGYGFSSAYMLFFEGQNILREHLAASVDAFARLRAVAERDLPVPEYEQMVARVQSNQSGLIHEIANAAGRNYCGVGPAATRYIREIARDLPGFDVLSGTTGHHNCADNLLMERIADAYRQDIRERLQNHPMLSQKGVGIRQKTLADVQTIASYQSEELKQAAGSLSGVANLLFRFSLFSEVASVLQRAAVDYVGLHQSLKAVSAHSARAIPDIIDLSMLHRVLSGLEMPSVLLERVNKIATWFGFLLPLLLDSGGVIYARRVLAAYRRIVRLAEQIQVGDTDVAYLWRTEAA